MALNTLNTDAISFKKLSGKVHTQQNFAVTEEGISTNVQSSYSTVFANPIVSLPVTTSGLTALYATNGIVERVKFQIDIIPDTQIAVGRSQGYRLKLPSDYNTFGELFPEFSAGTYLHTAIGKLQIVPSLYGTLKPDGSTEYDPILYQTNGSTVIAKFDPINWYFDPYSGILFVQDPPVGYDSSAARPGYLEAFLYVGDYLDDILFNMSSGATGTTGLNVGGGVEVFKDKVGETLRFRTINGTNGINVTGTSNNIIISFSGFTGAITGATNGLNVAGGGSQVGLGGTLTGNTIINGERLYSLNLGGSSLTGTTANTLTNINLFASTGVSITTNNFYDDGGYFETYETGLVLKSGLYDQSLVLFRNNTDTDNSTYKTEHFTKFETFEYGGFNIVYNNIDTDLITSGVTQKQSTILSNGGGITIDYFDAGNGGSQIYIQDDISLSMNDSSGNTASINVGLINNGIGGKTGFVRSNPTFGTGIGHLARVGSGNALIHGSNNTVTASTTIYGIIASGERVRATNIGVTALGRGTRATGLFSFIGGWYDVGSSNTAKAPQANASAAFGFYSTNGSQTDGHGVNAAASAILGGYNHNIESGNVRSAIIGGNSIKLTGSTYIDHTAVGSLVIWDTPSTGVSGDSVLVRDAITKKIKVVSQSSIAGGSGSVTASNGLTKIGNNIVLGGSLTGDTSIGGDVDFSIITGIFGATTENSVLLSDTSGIVLQTVSPSVEFSYLSMLNGGINVQTDNGKGIEYISDMSATFTPRSLVDKGYVTGLTSGMTSVGASNGLSKVGNNIVLGGYLTGSTSLDLTGNSLSIFGVSGSGFDMFLDGGDISLEAANGGSMYLNSDLFMSIAASDTLNLQSGFGGITTLSDGGMLFRNRQFGTISLEAQDTSFVTRTKLDLSRTIARFTDTRTGTTAVGLQYAANYSANFTARSLVDKGYVTGLTTTSGVQTANNGLTKSGTNVRLGGTLTGATTINLLTHQLNLSGSTGGVKIGSTSNYVVASDSQGVRLESKDGNGITIKDFDNGGIFLDTKGTSGGAVVLQARDNANTVRTSIRVQGNLLRIDDNRTGTTAVGLQYNSDYSANFIPRSLVDKGYVDGLISGSTSGYIVTASTFTATTESFVGVSAITATTIYLPTTPIQFKQYIISDISGNALTNNITINGNGYLIVGSSTAIINTNYGSITFVFNGYNWSVVSVV